MCERVMARCVRQVAPARALPAQDGITCIRARGNPLPLEIRSGNARL